MKHRRRLDNQEVIRDFKTIHGDTYNYNLMKYKTMHHKVKIVCNIHGEFEQTPNHHFRRKAGCPKCSQQKQVKRMTDTIENFVAKAIIKHGNRYDYSKTVYGLNAREIVHITCKEHGDFKQTPNNHLRGQGCPACGKKKSGWTRDSWRESCIGRTAKLYIIRCFNENEDFYKIGITNKETISQRFRSTLLPYTYEIVKIITSKEDPIYIYDLEKSLHKLHNRFSYKPLIKFEGDTECFTKILPIIINYAECH